MRLGRSLPAFADATCESLKERQQGTLFLRGKVPRPDFGIKVRIRPAALGVELDHILQRRQTAVVHVRSCARHLSQGRRLRETEQLADKLGPVGPVCGGIPIKAAATLTYFSATAISLEASGP